MLCKGPLCNFGPNGSSLFRCLKKALKPQLRGNRVVFWCTYLNDECIGIKCQYASCAANAAAADGTCTYVVKTEEPRRDILDEARKIEEEAKKLRSVLRRRGLDDLI